MWGIVSSFRGESALTKTIAGEVLVQIQIENLLKNSFIDRIIVISNDAKILALCYRKDIETIFVKDISQSPFLPDGAYEIAKRLYKTGERENVMVCSALYPLLDSNAIEKVIKKFYQDNPQMLMGFSQTKKYPIWLARPLKEIASVITDSQSIGMTLECDSEYIWNTFASNEDGKVLYGALGFIRTPLSPEYKIMKCVATLSDVTTLPYTVELKPQGSRFYAALHFENMPYASQLKFILRQYCRLEQMEDISKYMVAEHWFVNPLTSIITDSKTGKPIFGRQDVPPVYVPNRAFCIIGSEALEKIEDLIAKGNFDYYIISHPENLCVEEPLEFLQAEAILERSLQDISAK